MRRRSNPTEMLWWLLGLGGAAAAVGGVVYVATRPAPTTSPGSSTSTPTTIPSGQGAVAVLVAGTDSYNATLSAQGGMLTVTLPSGASVASGGASVSLPSSGATATAGYTVVNSDGSATSILPVASAFTTGQNTLTITWTDSANVSHTSTVTVTVAM